MSTVLSPEVDFMSAAVESGKDNRIDGRLKVTGAMDFAADLRIQGALHAAALRSPYPHARIVRVDVAQAAALPGVRCVLTGADMPNIRSGRALRDVPVLAVGKARFAGEMVAGVAADTPEIAQQALDLIHVEYEPLTPVFDAEQALLADAPAVHDNPSSYAGATRGADEPINVIARAKWKFGSDVEAALAGSDRVFEHTFRTQKVHQGYIEPHCCTVDFDRQGQVRIWSCNKGPYRMKEYLAATFDLAPEDIQAYTTAIGGDFGGKGSPMDIPLCLELSRRTGHPVRMLRTYPEELIAGDPRHSSVTTIKMGVSNDGRIQGMQARTLFNSGAYGGYRPSANMRSAYGTSYRIPAAYIEVVRMYTNEVPCGNMRAPGAPQTCYAMEAMMDFVANGLNIDPFEFRRINVLHDGETTLMGHAWPESRGLETLNTADQASPPKRATDAAPNLRFGRGVALYDRPTHAPQHTSLRLRLAEDGRIEAQVPIMETGTGSHTMLQRVLATALGMPREDIFMRYVGTSYLPWDEGVGGSRVTVSAAEAGVLGAKAFMAALGEEAAKHLNVPAGQVEVQPGCTCVDKASGRRMSLVELGAAGLGVEAIGETDEPEEAEGATSFCAQVAQVAVDTETGQVFLTEFASAHDVAEILDPLLHRGQIEGGVAMGMGFALSEDLGIVDGQVTAAHLGDYKLPTIVDVPPLKVALLPGSQGVGARNIKSIGEIGNVPTGAAIANAVSDAVGMCMDSLPITAEKVLAALQSKQKEEATK
jgi:CO/xanthine dehydrogenase Mo-binding subunit